MSEPSQPSAPASPLRPWRIALYLLLVGLAAAGFALPASLPSGAGAAAGAPAVEMRFEADGAGARVISLSGSAEEMGLQQGLRLREEIRAGVSAAWRQCAAAQHDSWRGCRARAEALGRLLSPTMRAEARGMAQGAGVHERDILLLNSLAAEFVGDALPPTAGLVVWGAATPDGDALLGGVISLRDAPFWMARRPADAPATLVLAWPGWLGGLAGFVDGAGAALALPLPTADQQTAGLPTPIILRLALELNAPPADTVSAIMGWPHAAGAQLFFADAQGNAASIEFTAHQQRRLAAELDTLTSAGLFSSADLALTQTPILSPAALSGAQARWDKIENLARANVGWLGVEKSTEALRGLGQGTEATLVILAPAQGQLWTGTAGPEAGRLLVLRPDEVFAALE